MKKTLRRALAVFMTASLLFTLVACGDSGDGKVAAGREEGSLIFNVDWPAYIDPGVGSKLADALAHTNMYDSLTFPNEDGTVEPLACESWSVNDNSTEYTFALRKGMKFHSGNEVKASDVKFSFDRLIALGEGYAYLFSDVKSCDVIDDYNVKFILNAPSGIFPMIACRIYILDEALVMENITDGAYDKYGDYGKAWLNTNDAGSGPYKVKEMITESSLTMERFEDYWKGWDDAKDAPKTAKMLGNVAASTVKTMISRGELDITDDTQTPEALEVLNSMDGVTVIRALSGVNFNVCLNTKSAPTDDIHVRRAMAYAVDYDTVCNNIYVGSSVPTGPIVRALTASALDESEFPFTYDLEKAKKEIEESKYYNDLISGKRKITLSYCSEGGEQQEKLALLIQAGMSKLGVTVEVAGKPFATMMSEAAEVKTTPNASFVVFAPTYLEGGGYLYSRYHSNSAGTWEQMEWLQNKNIDKEITNAMRTADDKSRNELYKKISKEIVELCPTLWVADLASPYAYRSDYVTKFPAAEKYEAGTPAANMTGYHLYLRNIGVAQ